MRASFSPVKKRISLIALTSNLCDLPVLLEEMSFKKIGLLLLFVLGVSSSAAAQSIPGASARVGGMMCIPGAQLACGCLNGGKGVQVCRPDGAGLGPCRCAPETEKERRSVKRPYLLKYKSGEPIPQGYEVRTRYNQGLLIPGLSVLGGLYLLSGTIASIIDSGGPSHKSHRWLYVPVIGSFVAAANPAQSRSDRWTFILVLNGLLQTAGAISAIWAVADPIEELIRVDTRVSVLPYATSDGAGVGLAGVF